MRYENNTQVTRLCCPRGNVWSTGLRPVKSSRRTTPKLQTSLFELNCPVIAYLSVEIKSRVRSRHIYLDFTRNVQNRIINKLLDNSMALLIFCQLHVLILRVSNEYQDQIVYFLHVRALTLEHGIQMFQEHVWNVDGLPYPGLGLIGQNQQFQQHHHRKEVHCWT